MKIGFFNSHSIWGGGEKWHFEMSSYAHSVGATPVFFTPEKGRLAQKVSSYNFKIVNITMSKLFYLNPISQIRLWLSFKREKLDVLVLNSFVDVRACGIIAKLAGVPKVVLRCGNPVLPKRKLSYILSFRYGLDYFVANSTNIKERFEAAPSLLKKSQISECIINGIDLNKFYKKERSNSDIITIGVASRLSHEKGIDLLLKVTQSLLFHGCCIKVKIAGTGELEESLKLLAVTLNVDKNVEFLGHVENIAEFTRELDICTFPSRYEGASNTIIESMACGIPVVAFDTSGMSHLIENGNTGFLIEPFSTYEFAKQTKNLIDNEEIALQMGENARQIAQKLYNSVDNFEKWYNFLKE